MLWVGMVICLFNSQCFGRSQPSKTAGARCLCHLVLSHSMQIVRDRVQDGFMTTVSCFCCAPNAFKDESVSSLSCQSNHCVYKVVYCLEMSCPGSESVFSANRVSSIGVSPMRFARQNKDDAPVCEKRLRKSVHNMICITNA